MSVEKADPIWEAIRKEAAEETRKEPLLANFLYGVVLNHKTFEDALSFILATKLESTTINAVALRDLIDEALVSDPEIGAAARADIAAVLGVPEGTVKSRIFRARKKLCSILSNDGNFSFPLPSKQSKEV